MVAQPTCLSPFFFIFRHPHISMFLTQHHGDENGFRMGFQFLKRAVMLAVPNLKTTLPFSNSSGIRRDCSGIGKDFDERLSTTQSGPSARSGRTFRAPPGALATTARTRLHSRCQLQRLRIVRYVHCNESGHCRYKICLFSVRSRSVHLEQNRADLFHLEGCVPFCKCQS